MPTASEGAGESVVEKPLEHATDTAGEKNLGNALPQTQITSPPETFAFRNVKAEPGVSTSASTATSKTGTEFLSDIYYFYWIRLLSAYLALPLTLSDCHVRFVYSLLQLRSLYTSQGFLYFALHRI